MGKVRDSEDLLCMKAGKSQNCQKTPQVRAERPNKQIQGQMQFKLNMGYLDGH